MNQQSYLSRGVGTPLAEALALRTNIAKERKVLLLQTVFIYCFWVFVGTLGIFAMLAAWLDTREVARNYLAEQKKVIRGSVADIEE